MHGNTNIKLQLSVNCKYANTKSCLYVTIANIASHHFKPMNTIIHTTNLSTDSLLVVQLLIQAFRCV